MPTSLITIGIGAEEIPLAIEILTTALLGIVLVIGLWWRYFDYVVLAAETRLGKATGADRSELARDSYSYIHLLIVGSIILVALGILSRASPTLGNPLG